LILLQYLRFGPAVKRRRISWAFYIEFLLGLAVTFALILFLGNTLKDQYGAYAAFGQNLMMSVLFIVMLRDRKTVDGQSIYIAIFKMLGTLLASVAFYTQTKTYSHSPLMQLLFVAILVYDVIYVVMLHRRLKQHHIKPLRRL
jgi:peptidoglycan/LPS O-acetylase OafA/YrhL